MRIWIARAEAAAARTAKRLAALGHQPLVAPVLEIATTATGAPTGPFDAVLITSANAVAPLVAAGFADATMFAVGRRSADAARQAGCGSVLSAEGDAGDLTALIQERVAPGAALLHVAGEDRKLEPAAALRAAGYRLSVWTAYAARPVDSLPPSVAAVLNGAAPALDAALHYSRRSAEVVLALVETAGQGAAFRRVAQYCLSADVAAPLVEAGVAVHFVPARPDEDSLLAGLPRGA